jgi:cob(I)alamin adenosyltransferase
VAGFQYIADPNQATADELRQETARLRTELAAAVQEVAADLPPDLAADLADAQTALAQAEEELAQEEPAGRRVIRQLKTAAEILTETGKMAEAAQKVGQIVLKWAPAAAALYQIAQKLFGG